ncbi:maleylpyruvate isomerase family mycothiol-dependent enzyme [Mycobacterium paraffinicum]|uniref:Maleylpyruvate isomerase family mycothiol-dependent enzyme n=1 Tax=Mycobacterium paraffinicum TaxID=53378 RepID=A0ABP8RJY6_9MYCO|nr:maleylpyruvate isomerase family mycothiol-dependent enzyme [Mycobacterium paraffinicum]
MRVDRGYVFAAVADQRHQIATLIDRLDDAQLGAPSLCAGWDIKTVAAHLVSVFADSFWVFMGTALRRGSMARAIDELARRRARLPAADIAATLRGCAEHPLSPPLFGPLDPLADVLVHSGDIRLPLDLPFKPDPGLAALALDFLTGPWPFGFVRLGRLWGISLYATDVDRAWGRGIEVCGPAAALMMTVTGRPALLRLRRPGAAPPPSPTAARKEHGRWWRRLGPPRPAPSQRVG